MNKTKHTGDNIMEAMLARVELGVRARQYAEKDTEDTFAALEYACCVYNRYWESAMSDLLMAAKDTLDCLDATNQGMEVRENLRAAIAKAEGGK